MTEEVFKEAPLGMTGRETCQWVKEQGAETVLLAFSGGKDSVAAYLVCREFWEPEQIVPYYLYLVPNLRIVEQSLTWFERNLLNRRVIRLPHPSLYRWINTLTFAAPEQGPAKIGANLPEIDYVTCDILATAIAGLDYDDSVWVANGVRASDSPLRRMAITKYGSVNLGRQLFYPVHDMRVAEVADLLRTHKVKLGDEYRLFGRSFDGLDYRFLKGLAAEYPDDYAHLLRYFPLAVLEFVRRGEPIPESTPEEYRCRR